MFPIFGAQPSILETLALLINPLVISYPKNQERTGVKCVEKKSLLTGMRAGYQLR